MAKRYSLITSNDHEKFVEAVTYALNCGWELQGGVALAGLHGDGTVNGEMFADVYAQAMVRTDETKFFPDER